MARGRHINNIIITHHKANGDVLPTGNKYPPVTQLTWRREETGSQSVDLVGERKLRKWPGVEWLVNHLSVEVGRMIKLDFYCYRECF